MNFIDKRGNLKAIKDIPFGGSFEFEGKQFIKVDDSYDYFKVGDCCFGVNKETGILHSFFVEAEVREIKESKDELVEVGMLEDGTVFGYSGEFYVNLGVYEDREDGYSAFNINRNVRVAFFRNDKVKPVKSTLVIEG